MDKSNKELENLSKEELEKKMHEKNLQALKDEGGLASLLIFNLENFAYRYLETSTQSNIKCQFDGNDYWVSSIESDVVAALKWDNAQLKSSLIALCKEYSGAKSKEIKIKLLLGSKIVDEGKVECYSMINWNFPNFEKAEGKYLEKTEQITFDDPMVLRNTHAAHLENVASIF
jgi:hypothetical protein